MARAIEGKHDRAVLRFIVHHTETEGWAPSLREIASGVGMLSVGRVLERVLFRLEQRGSIVWGRRARQIRVTEIGHELMKERSQDD